ncbi:hypothetical protein ABIB26_002417 [Arthrobacter sp. UYEF20]
MFVIERQSAAPGDGCEGVHQPRIALLVWQEKRCSLPEIDQVVLGQPCFLTKFLDGLPLRRGSRLEISGDAMPASAVMSDGLASLEEGDPSSPLNDHGHYGAGRAFCG